MTVRIRMWITLANKFGGDRLDRYNEVHLTEKEIVI